MLLLLLLLLMLMLLLLPPPLLLLPLVMELLLLLFCADVARNNGACCSRPACAPAATPLIRNCFKSQPSVSRFRKTKHLLVRMATDIVYEKLQKIVHSNE